MKKTKYLIGIIAAIGILIAAFFTLKSYNSLIYNVSRGTGVSDTITVRDTIFVEKPVVIDSTIIETKVVKVPIYRTDTITSEKLIYKDSIEVVLPIVQKEYKDSTYHAWVSGYEANLDSIEVYRKTTTITNNVIQKQNKRFGVGFQLGVGVNQTGKVQPYVGIGISYNLLNF